MEESKTQIAKENNEINIKESKQEKKPIRYFLKFVKEILAVLFWTYVLIKLFVFDIDIFLVNILIPEYIWLLNLKFLILISTVALVWLFTKNKQILSWSLYVIFYPIIVLLWKIPLFFLKQRSWILVFAIINSIIFYFKSIKYNFITSAFYLVSIATIFCFSNTKLLWSAAVVIFGILLTTYLFRFILIFKPSRELLVYKKILSGIKKYGNASFALDNNIKNLPVESLDKKQMEKWTTSLQTLVLLNRMYLFAAKKLRDYQNSGLNFISYVLTILTLVLLTIFSFATINYALFKIDTAFFSYDMTPSFFTFFYYSFNNLLFNSIKEITPVLMISQTVNMLESFFALFLVAIFISLILSVRSQRYSDELNDIVKIIKHNGEEMESLIKDEFKINNIDDAIVELEKLKAGFIKFIYKITENI